MLDRRNKYSYILTAPGGPFAFIRHPYVRGLWMRTHPCVILVDCEHCGAVKGYPCFQKKVINIKSSTHYKRRNAAQGELKKLADRSVVVMSTPILQPAIAFPKGGR